MGGSCACTVVGRRSVSCRLPVGFMARGDSPWAATTARLAGPASAGQATAASAGAYIARAGRVSLPQIPSVATGASQLVKNRRGRCRILGAEARESGWRHWEAGVWPAAAADFARLFVVRRDHPHGPRRRRRRQSGLRGAAVAMVKPTDARCGDHSAGVPLQRQVRPVLVVVHEVLRQDPSEVLLVQDDDVVDASRRIDPTRRSTYGFCQGDCGAMSTSSIPIALTRHEKCWP